MAVLQCFDQNLRNAVNGSEGMFQLPQITQKLFLMNSEASAFKDKRRYVLGIVRQ